MDDEQIENSISAFQLVANLGFQDLDHFSTFCRDVHFGFDRFGSTFQRALGEALMAADLKDKVKIVQVWQSACYEHQILFRCYMAKVRAENALE